MLITREYALPEPSEPSNATEILCVRISHRIENLRLPVGRPHEMSATNLRGLLSETAATSLELCDPPRLRPPFLRRGS